MGQALKGSGFFGVDPVNNKSFSLKELNDLELPPPILLLLLRIIIIKNTARAII